MTTSLKVLMQIRPDYQEKPGGDVVQLQELLPHLAALGVQAELTGDLEPDLSGYDLVHLINLDRPEEPYRHALHAIAQGKPIALSPVHTDMTEFLEWGDTDYWRLPDPTAGLPEPRPAPPSDPIELRRRALSHLQRQLLVDWATVYLPNSQLDADSLHLMFGMDLSRTVVVHHGLQDEFFEARPDVFVERYGLRDFVLCVGRIEKKKNQLGLLAALHGTGIPLVLAGQGNPPEYLELCRRYADASVHFLPRLSPEELASAYAAAKVHALPSWMELPGLTSLEAGAAGCNIVSTDRGSPREYLGEEAWYCDPRSPASIREAVQAAFAAPRSNALREHIRKQFTWRRAAELTVSGYSLALSIHQAKGPVKQQAQMLEAARRHISFLTRQTEDRAFEVAYTRKWAQNEVKLMREELVRITSRRFYRWSTLLAKVGWSALRGLGVKR